MIWAVPVVVPALTATIRRVVFATMIVALTPLKAHEVVLLKSMPVNATCVPTGPNVGTNDIVVTVNTETAV